jgi:hypothetical protein
VLDGDVDADDDDDDDDDMARTEDPNCNGDRPMRRVEDRDATKAVTITDLVVLGDVGEPQKDDNAC